MNSDNNILNNDFLEQFRNISNKLKKRFLRKPNVTEASDAFSSLGVQCELNEMPCYAGLCWIAAARCEGSLGNAPSEVNCLLRAARMFVQGELRNKAIGCPGPANEHLQAALSCYSYAGNRSLENNSLSSGINIEIADNLKNTFHLNTSSEQYLRQAILQSNNCLDTKLNCLGLLASTFIESGDYTSALIVFTEIVNILEVIPVTGKRTDILLRCEFSRIFLLLILRPTAQRLALPLARLLEKYMWGNTADPSTRVRGLSEHLFLLIQSLVMACQSQDISSLPEIEAELWPHLSTELRGLLRILIRHYTF